MPGMNEISEGLKFKCDMCGLCCKKIGTALKNKGIHPGLDEAIEAFPYKLVDGKCPKFKRNRCTVYEDRPLICRIDDLYTKYPDLAENREAWHNKQYESCAALKKEDEAEKKVLEKERLVRFRKALRYLGWDLDEAAIELLVNVHALINKSSSKLNLETLDEIQNEAYNRKRSCNIGPGYSVTVDDLNKLHESQE